MKMLLLKWKYQKMNKWKENWEVLELKELKQVEITVIGNRELIKVSTMISGIQKRVQKQKLKY